MDSDHDGDNIRDNAFILEKNETKNAVGGNYNLVE